MNETIKKIIPAKRITGDILVPSDKSITHRALMLASIAQGISIIRDPSHGLDCQSTKQCLQMLGVSIDDRRSFMEIRGVGRQGFTRPSATLDAGNSGSTLRMLSGILAGHPFESTLDGDESLRKRPMKRIIEPLKAMGAAITASLDAQGDMVCPITIGGRRDVRPLIWESKISSAQVKTAILLAALNASGKTVFKEPYKSRDHTELMMPVFGCDIKKSISGELSLVGPQQPKAAEITVCGDFSSAAFFIVAALLLPGGNIVLKDVGINPTRTGLLTVLQRMGAEIIIENQRKWGNEPVADIIVKHHELCSTTVSPEEVPHLIDEIPILSVAATFAEGVTVIEGAGELKYKESNRLTAITEGLNQMGAQLSIADDRLSIMGKKFLIGASVKSFADHRIAMSLTIAGLCAKTATMIVQPECVDISFPDFWGLLQKHAGR